MEARTMYGRDRDHTSSEGPRLSVFEDEADAAPPEEVNFEEGRLPGLHQTRPPGRSQRRLCESA
eukprot:2648587-Pleurochrysis_carterae.AAC.1